ncbi:ZIP zinc transporter-domain-containing protein [Chytridium lagenaria]|nr:ZIP zinc transporter-domain-containing protein [Chytridium lagenaria]
MRGIKTLRFIATFLLLAIVVPAAVNARFTRRSYHEGHDHGASGTIIVEHKPNPAAAVYKPADFITDLFSEYGTGIGANRILNLDDLVQIYQALSIIGGSQEEDPHAGHNHGSKALVKRQVPANTTEFDPCLLPYDLMTIYGLNTTAGLNRTQFERLSPALIYVSAAKLCKDKVFPTTEVKTEKPRPAAGLVWLYSIIANVLVTAGCMLGIAFVPLMRKSPFIADLTLSFFIALGAGTLIADALLHLIPSVLELHSHGLGEEHEHDHGSIDYINDFPYIWNMSIVMLGLYLFWSAEQLLSYLHTYHSEKAGLPFPIAHSHAHTHSTPSHEHGDEVVIVATSSDVVDGKDKTSKQMTLWQEMKTVRPVAILILLGDSLHNFVDGLAIGASFSVSVKLGLTTSIAVLLHELPHELGDYAILYASGFSALRAGILNAASNLTAFIGMCIGIGVTQAASASIMKSQQAIFAIASGMFIYIAVADLLPELRAVHAISGVVEPAYEEVEGKDGEVKKMRVGKDVGGRRFILSRGQELSLSMLVYRSVGSSWC